MLGVWAGREGTSPLGCRVLLLMGMVVVVMLLKESSQQTTLSPADLNDTESKFERIRRAKESLNFVEKTTANNCRSGTDDTLLLSFDKKAWIPFTDPATRTANLMSMLLAQNNNSLAKYDDTIFFNMVRNNVHGETLIYGSGIAFVEDVLNPPRTRYCPYSSRNPGGSVNAFDIAENYDYINKSTIWWRGPSTKDYSTVKVVVDSVNLTGVGVVKYKQPVANYSEGYWTNPYFDCGGGNIWMVTYLGPVLALNESGIPVFKGIASVDLELTNIDINQCNLDDNADDEERSLDVFRDTHNCQPTTKCVPIKNNGFKRGSYDCACEDGFYFPDSSDGRNAFRGIDIDNFFDNVNQTSSIPYTERVSSAAGKFTCLRCSRECVTCVDNSPCLFQNNTAIRIFVVLVIILLLCGCAFLSYITFKYRAELVMKTSSPSFLQIMICGAVLMCISVLLMYPEPTDILCTIFVWPFHLGFCLLYGSLLLKTWRISVIFNSRRKVSLTDKVLLQRLVILPGLMAVCLVAWTVVDPPTVDTIVMPDDKKFFACSFTYWNYGVYGAEVLMLLFGVYLSFTVRKAPAQFNESKYITWSIYNAIILGVFIITITQIMADSAGPDVLYVLLMLQIQVFDTIALFLIFTPKLWTLHKGVPPDDGMRVMGPTGLTRTQGGRTTATDSTNGMAHKFVQVNAEDLLQYKPLSNQVRPSPSGGLMRSNRVAPLDPQSTPALLTYQNLPATDGDAVKTTPPEND